MKHFIPFVLFVTILFGSCKEKSEKPSDGQDRMQAVIAVHDEVMPKMNEIGKLVAQLKPLADSTENGRPYRIAMRGFGDHFNYEEIQEGKALSPEKQELLETEMTKVRAMREQVLGSLERARELLAKQAE